MVMWSGADSIFRDVDNSKNPMMLTKDRLERAATENQFMNGKIHALSASLTLLFAIYSG